MESTFNSYLKLIIEKIRPYRKNKEISARVNAPLDVFDLYIVMK